MPEQENSVGDPASAGTMPQGGYEPLAGGAPMAPPTYAFPETEQGRVGRLDPGPLGNQIPNEGEDPPLLGYSKLYSLRTRTFDVQGGLLRYRIDIATPTAYVLYKHTFGAGDRGFSVGVSPQIPAEAVGLDPSGLNEYGLPTQRQSFYCFAPGTWYLYMRGTALSANRQATYLEFPNCTPELWDRLINPRGNVAPRGGFSATDQTLVAATSTEIVDLGLVLDANIIEVQNTGAANDVRLAFSNNPNNAFGIRVDPGETYVFDQFRLQGNRLMAFSNGGTTIGVRAYGRI